VAKTLVLKAPAGFVRAVLPSSCRVDVRKLAEAVGESRKHVGLATEDELAQEYPEFELGAVPPFGAGTTMG
jgi:Ala-tRNA(Pro) deacylase